LLLIWFAHSRYVLISCSLRFFFLTVQETDFLGYTVCCGVVQRPFISRGLVVGFDVSVLGFMMFVCFVSIDPYCLVRFYQLHLSIFIAVTQS
jgi:hypothetical protein